MKNVLLLFVAFLCFPWISQAQYGPEQLIVANDSLTVFELIDLDLDGDLDVLALYRSGGQISWFENTDGAGSFGPQEVLITDAFDVTSASAADFDLDGDLDILYASSLSSRLAWYENDQGNFGPQQLIADDYEANPVIADVDDDGRPDIVTSALTDDKVVWLENFLPTSGNFIERVISTDFDVLGGPSVVQTGDFNNDGELDVIGNGGNIFDPIIVWYENGGSGFDFDRRQKIDGDEGGAAGWFEIGDYDGDGDLDFAISGVINNVIYWYENLDGLGNFSEGVVIDLPGDEANSLVATDVDLDGDLDLVANSADGLNLGWYENEDGLGSFSEVIQLTERSEGFEFVTRGDIDGDGDDDLFAVFDSVSFVWYENLAERQRVIGFCFNDDDQDGIFDANEQGLQNLPVEVNPNGLSAWTNREGQFQFFLDTGNYVLTHQPIPNWSLTTPGNIDVVVLDTIQDTTYYFGLSPILEINEARTNLTSAATRCGFEVPYWLEVENTGTLTMDGQIRLELDPLVSYISADPLPASISGNTLLWDIADLAPFQSTLIRMRLQMPGVNAIGEEVQILATTEIQNQQGNTIASDTYDYRSIIACAYDPNDKLVNPDRDGTENFTLFTEALNYTVRFQNTGTDTAFNVTIEDRLDPDLDWSTLRPIASSHPYEVTMDETGLVKFIFSDILLPDSTTNEPASHGFIKFEILPKPGLAENTTIENRAGIFFDFNPPIITNQTLNTMVSMLPTSTRDIELDQRHVKVFPNPFSEATTVVLEDLVRPDNYALRIYDLTGRILQTRSFDSAGQFTLERGNLAPGMYFYQLIGTQGQGISELGKLMVQ
ncbi:MAG: T9SS type A sorting domain-containing protein [Bacteroidota bacterium]